MSKRFIAISLVLTFVLTFIAVNSFTVIAADAEIGKVQINSSKDTNVRSQPSFDGKIIGVAKAGKQYALLYERADWYKIRLNSTTVGWISSSLATVVSRSTATPKVNPTATPVPKAKSAASIKVGDTVTFGSYEQDNNKTNGAEAIEWIVLSKNTDDSFIVISKYGLDNVPYNKTYTDVTWETCSLRKWLNDEFFNAAFNAEQKAMIKTAKVTPDENTALELFPEEQGKATRDKVWILSIAEAEKYFKSDESRVCSATKYAKGRGVYVHNNSAYWWLRTCAYPQTHVAVVQTRGDINPYGWYCDNKGTGNGNADVAVRPVICVDFKSTMTAPQASSNTEKGAKVTPKPTASPTPKPTPTPTPKLTTIKTWQEYTLDKQLIKIKSYKSSDTLTHTYNYKQAVMEAGWKKTYLMLYVDWQNASYDSIKTMDILDAEARWPGNEAGGKAVCAYWPTDYPSYYPQFFFLGNESLKSGKKYELLYSFEIPKSVLYDYDLKIVFRDRNYKDVAVFYPNR